VRDIGKKVNYSSRVALSCQRMLAFLFYISCSTSAAYTCSMERLGQRPILAALHTPTATFVISVSIMIVDLSTTNIAYLIHCPQCFTRSVLITRRRSCSFAEYWKHFMARFNDVHASGYNSAGSERIWMKFGTLRAYCLELALTDFGRDSRKNESGRASRIFLSRK